MGERSRARGGARVYVDGSAIGNPGPAGVGVVIEQPGAGRIEISEPLAEMTNNQAEYRALLRALAECAERGLKEAVFYLDSELVVRQVNGEYRVKQAALLPLHRQVREALERGKYQVRHVSRERNRRANALAQNAARYAQMESAGEGQASEGKDAGAAERGGG